MTTSDDPQERLTVMDLVKNACQERIYPVGRLDRNTTGVLLLTNDGDLASKLTHPSFKKKKIYHVWLDKNVSIEDMEKIANGLELEDGEIHADAISYASEDDKSQDVTVSSVVFSNHWAITWLNWIVYILPVLQKRTLDVESGVI